MGFSVVFIAFGASASAVGQFLLQNKNLLAPFAGAIIVLFGLHLVGLLGRIPVRAGPSDSIPPLNISCPYK
jgi:cytochrome c-type biogenesis protein